MKTFKIICLFCAALTLDSCTEDFLEPQLASTKEYATSVNTVEDLEALILGAYDRMNESEYYGQQFVIYGDVRSDNAYSSARSGRYVEPGQFVVPTTHGYARGPWQRMYQIIAYANIVINAEIAVEDTVRVDFAKGQAHALRALAYMDLLRLYGQQWVANGNNLGVPIVTNFLDKTNIYPARATVDEVWALVESDLLEAERLIDPDYNSTDDTGKEIYNEGSPIHISHWTAVALQSRYYLYVGKLAEAAAAAQKIMTSGEFSIDDPWPGKESNSSIFELAYTDSDNEGINGLYFILQPGTDYGDIYVTRNLYNAIAAGDARKSLYTLYSSGRVRVTGKYNLKDYTDHVIIIRYEEVLLNYAEALIRLANNPADAAALTALNVIPLARNATPYTEATLDNVLSERRKELAMEGHRFFDLVRNGRGIPFVDANQTFDGDPNTPGGQSIPYGADVLAFPIPQAERDANPSIIQNPGY